MSKHIACVYEDGIMKHTESFLIKGREERLRESKGVNLIKVQ
jgi:predicted DNA-binding antitoxin AbrB/MazE fold protein